MSPPGDIVLTRLKELLSHRDKLLCPVGELVHGGDDGVHEGDTRFPPGDEVVFGGYAITRIRVITTIPVNANAPSA